MYEARSEIVQEKFPPDLGGPNFFLAFFDSGINLKCMLLTLQDKLGVLVAHITDSSAVEQKITKSGLIGPLTWLNHNT